MQALPADDLLPEDKEERKEGEQIHREAQQIGEEDHHLSDQGKLPPEALEHRGYLRNHELNRYEESKEAEEDDHGRVGNRARHPGLHVGDCFQMPARDLEYLLEVLASFRGGQHLRKEVRVDAALPEG